MTDKVDKETGELLNKENRIADFVKSPAWRDIKTSFVKKVVELNDLSTLDSNIENLAPEIEARKAATAILMDWITEIEGSKATSAQNAEVLRTTQEDEIIKIFPDN